MRTLCAVCTSFSYSSLPPSVSCPSLLTVTLSIADSLARNCTSAALAVIFGDPTTISCAAATGPANPAVIINNPRVNVSIFCRIRPFSV